MPHTFLSAAPGCPCAGDVSAGREVKAGGIRFHPHLLFPAPTLCPQDGVHALNTRPTECQSSASLADGAEPKSAEHRVCVREDGDHPGVQDKKWCGLEDNYPLPKPQHANPFFSPVIS